MQHERREAVAYFMRRLYERWLTTTSGGNISCRGEGDTVLVTASKSDKARLGADQVAVLGLDGENRTPGLVPTMETSMHLAIYRRHPWVEAVVHAHPVTASAFCATRRPIDTHLTAEGYAILGDPVFVPYACMGSEGLAQRVGEALGENVFCALLENHGVLAVGESLLQAFDRLEVLEVAARHTLLVELAGGGNDLTPSQLAELDALMGRGTG